MNFQLDAEQQLLQDSVRRFIDKSYGFEARAALLREHQGGSAANWRIFADNGWLAAALPEAHGGLGGGVLDTALITLELGRGLVIEPYLGCAVLAAQTLAAAADPAQQAAWLPALADGSQRAALAWCEASSHGNPGFVETVAQPSADGFILRGTKSSVLGAQGAHRYIVSARVGAGQGDDDIALFLVEAGARGLHERAFLLHDGCGASELVLDQVPVGRSALLGGTGSGLAALRHGLAHGIAAQCAGLVGAMEKAVEMTAEYLRVRKQFGVAIGSFQALQHRMADMAAEMEIARAMLHRLLASLETDPPALRQVAVSQAKALVGRAAKYVCGQAIQLHGGIGMTEEYAIGHYYKHAVVADLLFGGADAHEAACAEALQRSLAVS